MSVSECSKRTSRVGEGVSTQAHALLVSLSKCSCIPYVIQSPPSSPYKRTNRFESSSRIPSSFSPSPSCGCVSGLATIFHSKSPCSGRCCITISSRTSSNSRSLVIRSSSWAESSTSCCSARFEGLSQLGKYC